MHALNVASFILACVSVLLLLLFALADRPRSWFLPIALAAFVAAWTIQETWNTVHTVHF